MKIVANEEARRGKDTIYRQILAACLRSIRHVGEPPGGTLRYYCATYMTYRDGVVGYVVYDRQVAKWTHADCRFYTGNGDETETRLIMFE